jgi:hypothetical protein
MLRNRINLHLSFVCLGMLLLCCQGKKHITYYSDGKVESVTEIKNEIFEGKRQTFYPSGEIKSVENFRAGKLNGLVEHFYEGGQLKSKANWIDGAEFGRGVAYYESGNKLFEAEYDSGKIKGYSKVYFESGQLKEKKLYDGSGELCYIMQFNEKGKLRDRFVVPIVRANRDTLTVNDECLIKISYGLKLTGRIRIVAEQIDSSGNVEKDKYIFESDGSETTIYRHTFSTPGIYKMVFKFMHDRQIPGDTLSINGVESNCKITVREGSVVKS